MQNVLYVSRNCETILLTEQWADDCQIGETPFRKASPEWLQWLRRNSKASQEVKQQLRLALQTHCPELLGKTCEIPSDYGPPVEIRMPRFLNDSDR